MSYDHRTIGRDAYTNFLGELKEEGVLVLEVPNRNQPRGADLARDLHHKPLPLRMARFPRYDCIADRNVWIRVEEILSVNDWECDGLSIVSIIVYIEGKRPSMRNLTLELKP